MKSFLCRYKDSCLPRAKSFLDDHVLNRYFFKSYSQEGEDMILRRIFEMKKTGFYVDVGAYHPKLFSNTYLFYKEGWRGINIEPNPAGIRLFEEQRKLDINLAVGVSDVPSERIYYMFNEPALNTFEESIANMPSRTEGQYHLIGETTVNVRRLDNILEEYLPKKKNIDFISIDVEGHELNVIRSNDWGKYRPHCLLVEVLTASIPAIMQSDLHKTMTQNNYTLYAKTANTLFYLDNSR